MGEFQSTRRKDKTRTREEENIEKPLLDSYVLKPQEDGIMVCRKGGGGKADHRVMGWFDIRKQ